jgi:glycosyltransferase involved in cell wall biosynthesis
MSSVVLVGTYPPRRCGIASFTAHLRDALVESSTDLSCSVVAIEARERRHHYPREVSIRIREEARSDYAAAAAAINASRARVVCLQHEFGIFGGAAGAYVLDLVEALAPPLIVTLHTVLEQPYDAAQQEVMGRLAACAHRLVVMSERGRELLAAGWGVSRNKTVVIPHGGPTCDAGDRAGQRKSSDCLLTFGLLGPDKGIETVIRALPEIMSARPDTRYLVVGATHPNLVAREGERYREGLQALAEALGVAEGVTLQDGYAAMPDLLQYIQDADLCVLPYLKEAHITSGTLAYAAALGKPVISTPFWHAQDLLAEGAGVFTPFGDPQALAAAVIALLSDPERRESLGRRLAERVAEAAWAKVGNAYGRLFKQASPRLGMPAGSTVVADHPAAPESPVLAGLIRMTDDTGLLQHSALAVPDRRYGYCLDDNARALLLLHRLPGPFDDERRRLARIYAAFVEHSWDGHAGCVRNFMGYDRQWLEARGSDDSLGRAVWALGATAVGPEPVLCEWARGLLDRMAPTLPELAWVRSNAFVILGLAELHLGGGASPALGELLSVKAQALARSLSRRTADWLWFEDSLSYDNARLPEALIRAGIALGNEDWIADGIATLTWLCARQTAPEGHFRPVATADFGRPHALSGLFDQQPLEAAATLEACEAALQASGSGKWLEEAQRAFTWYLGANDLGLSLLAGRGECYDGLFSTGVNRNQGAESILSLQFALCALHRIDSIRP